MADIESEDTGLLSDRIRNALTDAISSGELAPGTMLDEQQLADRYGASRTPVREALRQLATSGMVEVRPRRGVIVRHVTAEEVMDMFETMAELEAVCVRLATYRITPLERSRLLRVHEASEAAVVAGDVDAYDALNREFHEAIYRAAHNDFLADQAIAVRTRLNAFRRMQLRQDRRLVSSRAEHDAVMSAIAEGDGDEAARRMRAHMLNAASALDSYIAHQDAAHAKPAG
ncbi:GntR family transcriptional regulator [Sphingomonas sp. CFBP9019]|uniref:GntR family transcriptional regulator n=1 Tax=Sphingomonas sp. CFBP9019 TaxID=3096532 RepID=UPI002A69E9CC|nr:GntR family transcriptional regulator [Sphingomonas sp. CFBP9019]MDY1007133.1 GntR family transcriptional regulator [Sphingomonas sp. CFBP9019]